MTMSRELEGWAGAHPEVSEWLASVGDKARPIYARRFKNFVDWLTVKEGFSGMGPGQLLDYQERATGRHRADIAIKLSVYLGELARELRPKTLTSYYSAARSFFTFHSCDLPKRRFSLPDNHKRKAPQELDREKLVRILHAAKPRDRALYTFAAMGGLGWQEFDYINREMGAEVQRQLDEGRDRLSLHAPPRKRNLVSGRPFPVVVGGDAAAQLREYIKIRGRIRPGEPIFTRHHGGPGGNDDPAVKDRPYRKNFEMLARRVQIIEGKGTDRTSRYNVSTHQLRDVFRSEWQRSGADPAVCELLMGHVVDPNEYLKFTEDYILEQYGIAEPRLSYVSAPDLGVVPLDEVDQLREELTAQEARIAQLEREKYLAEHSTDYLLARLDASGVPVSPRPEDDPLSEAMLALGRLASQSPEEFSRLVRQAMKKAGAGQ